MYICSLQIFGIYYCNFDIQSKIFWKIYLNFENLFYFFGRGKKGEFVKSLLDQRKYTALYEASKNDPKLSGIKQTDRKPWQIKLQNKWDMFHTTESLAGKMADTSKLTTELIKRPRK